MRMCHHEGRDGTQWPSRCWVPLLMSLICRTGGIRGTEHFAMIHLPIIRDVAPAKGLGGAMASCYGGLALL